MNNTDTVLPGATIGILGGGQLGRMLALAAARLGMKTHIYCPDPQSPAFEVTPNKTVAAYDDEAALAAFAAKVDLVTYEFENVPEATAAFLANLRPLAPDARALAISQDRFAEKGFLEAHGIPIAPYCAVSGKISFDPALAEIGVPSVLKTTRLGYDGKGQRMIRVAADADAAFEALAGTDLVLEGFVAFEREISVIAARNRAGDIRCFDPAENVHRNHILHTSTLPAQISAETAAEAIDMAGRIAEALDYVGVLGVEFFVQPGGGLLVNEIAPRVHNSGHWTEAVCLTDQFEQHIRAICNWPLGDPLRMSDVVMTNLIGDEIDTLPEGLRASQQPHHYGKAVSRPGRKMGHVNTLVSR